MVTIENAHKKWAKLRHFNQYTRHYQVFLQLNQLYQCVSFLLKLYFNFFIVSGVKAVPVNVGESLFFSLLVLIKLPFVIKKKYILLIL